MTYLSPKCSNEGHVNTITYLESFGCLWRKTMREIQKTALIAPSSGICLLLCLQIKTTKGRNTTTTDHCQREIPKGCLVRSLSGAT